MTIWEELEPCNMDMEEDEVLLQKAIARGRLLEKVAEAARRYTRERSSAARVIDLAKLIDSIHELDALDALGEGE